jgi:serine/threonine protein kinase
MPGQELADRFRYREMLGETSLARTQLASDAHTGGSCVIKSLQLSEIEDEKTLELFHREARVLANLDHPFIPNFLGVFEEGSGEDRTLNLVPQVPSPDSATPPTRR